MSDIKEALVHSEENAVAIKFATENKTQFPVAALPGNMKIHDLEEYQLLRNQFRGLLHTQSIPDFVSYTNIQGVGSCFIDREEMSARSIFDIGTLDEPGHCLHRAKVKLKETAAFSTIKCIGDNRISQQDLAEFIEDWISNISVFERYGDDVPMDIKEAAEAVRNVTIVDQSKVDHGVQSFSVNKSAIESLNATSKDKPLPGIIVFTCVPYKGLIEYTFTLRISMIIRKNDTPVFSLRSVKPDETLELMQEEFIDLVTVGIDDTVEKYIGAFNAGT